MSKPQPFDADSEALTLLREIRDDVRFIRESLEHRRARDPQANAANAALVHAIAASCGDRNFTGAELIQHAAVVENLRAAIMRAVGALNAKKLGKLLRRIEGHEFDSFTVRRLYVERKGVLWAVACLRI